MLECRTKMNSVRDVLAIGQRGSNSGAWKWIIETYSLLGEEARLYAIERLGAVPRAP